MRRSRYAVRALAALLLAASMLVSAPAQAGAAPWAFRPVSYTEASLPAHGIASVVYKCPFGYVALGGGFDTSAPTGTMEQVAEYSATVDDRSAWVVTVHSFRDNPTAIDAYAVCARGDQVGRSRPSLLTSSATAPPGSRAGRQPVPRARSRSAGAPTGTPSAAAGGSTPPGPRPTARAGWCRGGTTRTPRCTSRPTAYRRPTSASPPLRSRSRTLPPAETTATPPSARREARGHGRDPDRRERCRLARPGHLPRRSRRMTVRRSRAQTRRGSAGTPTDGSRPAPGCSTRRGASPPASPR